MQPAILNSFEVLERTPRALEGLLLCLSDQWINTRESSAGWSVKEVVAHLIVCERTNWLPRARIMMSEHSAKTLEPINMTAHFELAETQSMEALLSDFKTLRNASVSELEGLGLKAYDFDQSALHPKLGVVTLHQLIATWVAHDLSHIAQVARILAKRYRDEVGPFKEYLRILQ